MSAHALYTKRPVICREGGSCDWYGYRLDADGSCPACGGGLVEGYPSKLRNRRIPKHSRGRFGEVSQETQDYIDAALKRAREDALR